VTPTLFITATNTDIGKSFITTALLEAFHQKGLRVGILKPIETGVQNIAHDATLHLQTIQRLNEHYAPLTVHDIAPLQYTLPSAPFIANNAQAIDIERIKMAIKKHQALCDILLIEGAGGTMVPINKHEKGFYYMRDLMKEVASHTLLIGHGRLGCMSDILCNMSLLEQSNIAYTPLLNVHDDEISSFETISLPFFNALQKRVFLFYKEREDLVNSLLQTLNLL